MLVRLTPYLDPVRIVRGETSTKWDAIETLVATFPEPEPVLGVVLERERRMSTGLELGVALPHGMLPGLNGTIGALGVFPQGIDFDSFDGELVSFVVLMVFPDTEEGRALHVALLASALKLLTEPAVRDGLLAAANPADIFRLLHEAETRLGM